MSKPTTEALQSIAHQMRIARDEQLDIVCETDDVCICNSFDTIIDSIEELKEVFEKKGEV